MDLPFGSFVQLFFGPLFPPAALFAAVAGILLLKRFRTTLSAWGGIFTLVMALDLICYSLVLTGKTSSSIQFWFRILVIIYSFLLTGWLFFIFTLTGRRLSVNLRTIILSGTLPALAAILLLDFPRIDPVWLDTVGTVTGWARTLGWMGNLYIILTFSVGLLSMGLLIQVYLGSRSYFRHLAVLLFIGTLAVIVAGLLELVGRNPLAPVSIVQILYVVNSMLALIGVFMLHIEGVLPLARTLAFDHMQDGLLVLDQNDNVIDLNPAASGIIDRADRSVIGRPITEAWKQGAEILAGYSHDSTIEGEYILQNKGLELTFDIKISPVLDPNRQGFGRIIVLRNVTGRERMERALQQQTSRLIRTNELVIALSNVAACVGRAADTALGFDVLGAEMRKLGLNCGVVAFDSTGETATMMYLSFNPALIQRLERLTGISVRNYVIPKRLWPGDRILKEKAPVWYPNLQNIVRRMFPRMSSLIAEETFRILDIQSSGQICVLPLLVNDAVIGVLPVWGSDLEPTDDPVLALFASQVAGILQNTIARENEARRADELARSNAMILALSRVATLLGSTQNSELILDILGSEIRGLGLDCGIVTLDPIGETAIIKYLSIVPAVLHTVEKWAGVSAKDYVIPRQYWPDNRVLQDKAPVWYSDPRDMLRQMFPQIPEKIARKALQFLGFGPKTQLCMLPLISREQARGAMLIWGTDLHRSDGTILAAFASQVAGILQNASAYEEEAHRANELARSNSMILALSKVAARLESSSDSAEIFGSIGMELKKIGMDSMIGILDENKQNLHIKYISISQDIIDWVEKITGHSLDELSIPRRLWPTEKVVDEKIAYWDPNLMRQTLHMFPMVPQSLHKTVVKLAGINLDDPVCYLPLANERAVVGVLAVWGTRLNKNDVSALSVLASQIATAIRNSELYEAESRRALELGILLEASEATSSSLQLNEVLLSLASKLLELSGFESCSISEWDRDTNTIQGLINHSRVFWHNNRRDSFSLRAYPCSREVLYTGLPLILEDDFEAKEKQWIKKLGRNALMCLALKAGEKTIGLAEIASTQLNKDFVPEVLADCQRILENAACSLVEPLSENSPESLYAIQSTLMEASSGDICAFWEWDRVGDRILNVALSSDLDWAGQSIRRSPEDPAWKMALHEGKPTFWACAEENKFIAVAHDSSLKIEVESMVVFPLQRGSEKIGLIELYDFNNRRVVTPEQIALLSTVADKASYSIQNARLLQQTQSRLREKTALLSEKEILLKEVHHRVKNNLQVISSLLNLQSARISDPDVQDALHESQNRVRTMALIHEKLYQSTELAQVNFASYLQSLAIFLAQSYRGTSGRVSIQVDAEGVMLDIDVAIPCGLIVNELVSNSLKYAFPDNRLGHIELACHQTTNRNYTLAVRDDGVGLPSAFDITENTSLGLKLVLSLVNQLEGKLEVYRDHGTTFMISFEGATHAEG